MRFESFEVCSTAGLMSAKANASITNRKERNANPQGEVMNNILDEIAANFEYEGWAVSRTADDALVLEREGQSYRVEVRDAEGSNAQKDALVSQPRPR